MMSKTTTDHRNQYTVLYIEDDHANRTLVKFIFERREDIRLIEAESGYEGIEMAAAHLPDIILLDLSLPDLSGFEVLQKLQNDKQIAETPIIALTGENLPEDRQKGLEAGFYGYLTKPINVQNFYAVIDETISHLSA